MHYPAANLTLVDLHGIPQHVFLLQRYASLVHVCFALIARLEHEYLLLLPLRSQVSCHDVFLNEHCFQNIMSLSRAQDNTSWRIHGQCTVIASCFPVLNKKWWLSIVTRYLSIAAAAAAGCSCCCYFLHGMKHAASCIKSHCGTASSLYVHLASHRCPCEYCTLCLEAAV